MRLFTAIGAQSIAFDPKVSFKKVKTNLLRKEIEHRWVPVENFHCTLNFLGEVDEERVSCLVDLLQNVSLRHHDFSLKLHGMEAFPRTEMGRVIWIGVQNSRELRSLQEDCLSALKNAEFPFEDRPYVPHLTVARLRNPRNLSDILSPLKNHDFGLLEVKKLSLYESKSGGSFPVYKEIAAFPLQSYLPMKDEINLM